MLSKAEQIKLIEQLAKSKLFKKINFAGGEPTLIPRIGELIEYAKSLGFETSIVTNGSRVDAKWVKDISKHLDILTISIDSVNEKINLEIGRNERGKLVSLNKLEEIAEACHKYNLSLKVNTVVSRFNANETLTDFINLLRPFRWKVLQATKIEGQNDTVFDEVKISSDTFKEYCDRNKIGLLPDIKFIQEEESIIQGSYLMIDSLGRFYDSSNQKHNYSEKILEVGVEKALSQIKTNEEKFLLREGNYTTIKKQELCIS